MKNICLFFGGKSVESDISIITACQTYYAIDKNKYNVFPIFIDKTGKWFYIKNLSSPRQFLNLNLKKLKQVFLMAGENILYEKGVFLKKICEVKSAILCNHGMNGEDGTLQGLLELSGVPYTSSGVTSSALNMDKVFQKALFEVNNLPVVNYVFFKKNEYEKNSEKVLKKIKQNLEFPLIVKPANLGSSIGINRSQNVEELKIAIDVGLHFDTKILVEEAVEHLKEINCACAGYGENVVVSDLDEPASWTEFFDFNQKYLKTKIDNKLQKNTKNIKNNSKINKNNVNLINFNENIEKIKVSGEISKKIKNMTKLVFKNLDCAGVVRVDYLLNADTEEIFINEVNTIPGSLANFMFPKMSFSKLIDFILESAEAKFAEKNSCKFCYESDVLNSFEDGKIKK